MFSWQRTSKKFVVCYLGFREIASHFFRNILKSGIDKRTFVRYNNKAIVAAGSGAYAV